MKWKQKILFWKICLHPLDRQMNMNMVVYTLEQRWEILQYCFENHVNIAECVRKLRTDFGRRGAQSASYVRYLVKKVKETGIIIDKPKREKPKTTSIHRRSTAIEHFGDFIETNFA